MLTTAVQHAAIVRFAVVKVFRHSKGIFSGPLGCPRLLQLSKSIWAIGSAWAGRTVSQIIPPHLGCPYPHILDSAFHRFFVSRQILAKKCRLACPARPQVRPGSSPRAPLPASPLMPSRPTASNSTAWPPGSRARRFSLAVPVGARNLAGALAGALAAE